LLPKAAKGSGGNHHEALPYTELPAFMRDLRHQGTPRARALELAILTATRTSETRGARWKEFDLAARVWTIPGSRMKEGREHRVPLSGAALQLLAALPRTGDRLFEIGERALYQAVNELRPGITAHGFRSTFRTWAQEQTEFAPEIAEHCLAHITGNASEAAYKRGDAIEKRREVMATWADFCAGSRPR
jgi:integrase